MRTDKGQGRQTGSRGTREAGVVAVRRQAGGIKHGTTRIASATGLPAQTAR